MSSELSGLHKGRGVPGVETARKFLEDALNLLEGQFRDSAAELCSTKPSMQDFEARFAKAGISAAMFGMLRCLQR